MADVRYLIKNSKDEWYDTPAYHLVPDPPVKEVYTMIYELFCHGFYEDGIWKNRQKLRPSRDEMNRYTWALIQAKRIESD